MGGPGRTAENKVQDTNELRQLSARGSVGQDPKMQALLSDYAAGKMGGKDAMSQIQGMQGRGTKKSSREYILSDTGEKLTGDALANYKKGIQQQADSFRAIGNAKGVGAGSLEQAQAESLMKDLQNRTKTEEFDEEIPGIDKQAAMEELATNALTGSKYATEEVQNNPILGQLFGKGGALERAGAEEKDLASRGYSLKPEDYEAYGQASGDISRLFGQQEQDLSQSLASRGLAAAPSGAAGVAFSGLQGNKMEQLAKAQTNIADKRMQNNMQRLNATRQHLAGLGQQGANAIQEQFGRQMAGRAASQGSASEALGARQKQQGLQQGQANTEFEQFEATKPPSPGEVLGNVAGGLFGAATGGLGAGLGKAVGGLFGGKK